VPRSASKRAGRPGRKKGAYSQAERVIALYDALQDGATVRVDVVAEELGVSTRQIQRDLTVLKGRLGSRLAQRADGAWHIPRERKRGHDRRLALAQILALELGAKLSAFLWEPGRLRAINTRMDGLRQELVNADEQRLRSWRRRVAVIAPGQKDYAGRPEVGKRLGLMLEAMVEERPVTLSYRSHRAALEQKPGRRFRAHPLGFVFYRDGIYFIVDVVEERDGASADLVGRRILLALDRVDDIELGDAGAFRVPADFDARAFFGDAFGIWRDGDARDVVVEIDSKHAPWGQERTFHPLQQLEQRTDGSLVVRMRVSGLQELSDWLLSLGEHAEVVEPPELRERVRARLIAATARYLEGGDIFCQERSVSSSSTREGRRRK